MRPGMTGLGDTSSVHSVSMEKVCRLYEKYGQQESTPPLLDDFEGIIYDLVTILSHAYIILDGIDEIGDRDQLLAFIIRLHRLNQLNILILSRPLSDIRRAFIGFPELQLEANMAYDDVLTYIKSRLQEDPKLTAIKPSLKAEIEATLVGRNEGMYLFC